MSADPQTFIYKEASGCEIRADVYPSGRSEPHPAVVWIHGGALINGGRGPLTAASTCTNVPKSTYDVPKPP